MEWKEVRLGDVCNIITGFPFPGKKYSKEGVRVVRGDNVTIGNLRWDTEKDKRWNEPFDKTEYYSLQANDIVIGMDGSRVGKNKARIKEEDLPLLLAQRVACVRHNELAEQDYLYYNIFSKKFIDYVNSIHTGSAIPHISQKQIEDYKILLPNLETQRRIASILSSLDRKIELNNKINADLEEMAQAIFKNWFVDFEPFKDGKFVDSELGMIPEGWKIGTLTDVIKLMPGGTPKTSEPLYWDNGTIPFFSPKDVNGVYCFTTEKHITETGLNKCSSNLYPKDTIFITCRGTVGKVCLTACDMAMNQSNYAIKAIDGYSQCYVFFLVKSVVERLIKKSNGAVFSAITSKDFDEEILIPSQKAVEDFTNVIDGFFRRIFTIGTENSRLSILRDTLLPRLMSGEIEVPE